MRQILTVILCGSILVSSAKSIKVDGIRYEISEDYTCIISPDNEGLTDKSTYSGIIDIPATIDYNFETYSVIGVGEKAFYNAYKLESVTLPPNIMFIDKKAFENDTSLTHIDLPLKLQGLGNRAFYNCINLKDITIPPSVQNIGSGAFTKCVNLGKFIIADGETPISLDYCLPKSGITEIYLGRQVIQDENRESVFDSLKTLTSLEFGKNYTYIPSMAFYGNTSLKSIVIPDWITYMGEAAFNRCDSLESIIIGDGLENIPPYAFGRCTNIKSEKFGKNIKYIGISAFELIDSGSGKGAKILEFPESLEYIESWAFARWENLEQIYFGSNLKYLYSMAFTSLKNVTEITCMAPTAPREKEGTSYYATAFGSNASAAYPYETATLYVPEAAIDDYDIYYPWRAFTHIVGIGDAGVEEIETNNQPVVITNLQGQIINLPIPALTRGIYIVRQGKNVRKIMIP